MKDVNVVENDIVNVKNLDSKVAEQVASQEIQEYNMKHIDLRSLGLSEKDLPKIKEVKDKFGEVNSLSVNEYGGGVSSRSGEYTKEILSLVQNKDLDETGQKLNQVLITAREINGNNLISNNQGFMARLPIIGGMFKSVSKAKENFQMKFANTNNQIESLVGEIEDNQTGLKHRVKILDKMFDSVAIEQKDIGIYIASGQLMLQDIQSQLKEFTNHDINDATTTQRVYDLNHLHNALEKRLYDMFVLQQACIQMLPQIRIIQTNNQMLVDKFQNIKNITIPAWKSQISMAIALTEQQTSVDLANAIDDATNSLLKRNADMLHTNSVKTAKAMNRSCIDPNVLEYTQNKLIQTVNDVIQIQQQGVKERDEATIRLKSLQENYKKLIVDDTMKKLAMK